ncbi:outer membrane protein [Acinetobacter calcoaceticus]|uniref:Outer membrane protein n=1 Tax=Acinetobacter calcoaceticus TaxID=471 RepID=A0A4R1XC24_ACICA|nr:outer membrane protein [Acinetobacter calcoaceticus]
MMNHMLIKKIICIAPLSLCINTSYAEDFKRFSVSAGWIHVMPQGSANPININTPVRDGKAHRVGLISTKAFLESIDPNAMTTIDPASLELIPDQKPENIRELRRKDFTPLAGVEGATSVAKGFGIVDSDVNGNVLPTSSGYATTSGFENWTEKGTGLEVKKFNTLGLMFNYYLNPNVSLQFIAGLPPKVDVQGKGQVYAHMSGTGLTNHPNKSVRDFLGKIPLKQDIPITNLGNKPVVSTVRAWTPAVEVQYQFGKPGVDKFRPYIGAGIMYAYFNQVKLNSETRSDLIAAGHMVQNILDGEAGAALDRKKSSVTPQVRVKAKDDFAPIVTLGFTYDVNENWFGIASVSYAKLSNRVNIDVTDGKGTKLIRSTTKVDIDPLVTYLGFGYRF